MKFDDGAERTIDSELILLGPLFGPLRDFALVQASQSGWKIWARSPGRTVRTSIQVCCMIGLSMSTSSFSGAGSALQRRAGSLPRIGKMMERQPLALWAAGRPSRSR